MKKFILLMAIAVSCCAQDRPITPNVPVPAIPEPSTLALGLVAITGAAFVIKKHFKK